MVFGLPAIGETSWGQKVLDSINAVKATADAAVVRGPAPSGDTSGATDTANLAALLAAGSVVDLAGGGDYYINSTLTLAGGNGLRMHADVNLRWVGAAGGSVLSTAAFSGASMAAWTGVLEGGKIRYPYASITAATKVVYIAQPHPQRPITTGIETEYPDTDHAVPAGSVGYDLDGNTNPGPFVISVRIHGQFDTQILARTSHVNAVACQGAYGGDLIRFDADSLGLAISGIDCTVSGAHAFYNTNSVVRLTQAQQVTVVGGLNETGGVGGYPESTFIYADATFSGFAAHLNPYAMGAGSKLTHYSTSGTVRIANAQDGYDATFTGQASGVPVPSGQQVQGVVTSSKTEWGTTSTASETVVVATGAIASSVAGRFKVRFIGRAKNSVAGNGYVVRLYQGPPAGVGDPLPGGATNLRGVARSAVATADEAEPVVMEGDLTGQNTADTYFYVTAQAITGGTATVDGTITVEIY